MTLYGISSVIKIESLFEWILLEFYILSFNSVSFSLCFLKLLFGYFCIWHAFVHSKMFTPLCEIILSWSLFILEYWIHLPLNYPFIVIFKFIRPASIENFTMSSTFHSFYFFALGVEIVLPCFLQAASAGDGFLRLALSDIPFFLTYPGGDFYWI